MAQAATHSSLGNLASTSWDSAKMSLGFLLDTNKKPCKVDLGGRNGWDVEQCSAIGGPPELPWSQSCDSIGGSCGLAKKGQNLWVSRAAQRVEVQHDAELLKVMIGGAPASGKGTQSELICEKYGLTYISTGDLLREEVLAGTENGKKAKECMEEGKPVPDEVVVAVCKMVKQKLAQSESERKGWLLDGYPRSLSQAATLEELGINPQIFILLDVPEDILIERIVGRRIDPATGKIYHLTYFPPETPAIASRLIQRSDDTLERAKLRLRTHAKDMEPALSIYKDIIRKVDGTADKHTVFEEIARILGNPKVFSPGLGIEVASCVN